MESRAGSSAPVITISRKQSWAFLIRTLVVGTGAAEMGDIMLLLVTGDVPFFPGEEENPSSGYRSSFSHDSEQASPGYYRVKLYDYKFLRK
jgi:hypothetical protein